MHMRQRGCVCVGMCVWGAAAAGGCGSGRRAGGAAQEGQARAGSGDCGRIFKFRAGSVGRAVTRMSRDSDMWTWARITVWAVCLDSEAQSRCLGNGHWRDHWQAPAYPPSYLQPNSHNACPLPDACAGLALPVKSRSLAWSRCSNAVSSFPGAVVFPSRL